jgi:hypothetical protein
MMMNDASIIVHNIAPCGLICSLCKQKVYGCRGCRKGGGDQMCYQRHCCSGKGIQGCWLCDQFPCDNGYFANEKWKGLVIAFSNCHREFGIDRSCSIIEAKFGRSIRYEEYTGVSEQNIYSVLINVIT